MKSKTSFFNGTIFRKDSFQFWPLWDAYLLLLLFMLPGNLWIVLRNANSYITSGCYSTVEELVAANCNLAPLIWVTALMAVASGCVLFLYCFNTKSGNMMHSLPVTRKELYLTHVIAGLVHQIGAELLAFAIAVLLCLQQGVNCLEYLGIWLGVAVSCSFFFFGITCFCVFLTGQVWGVIGFFFIIQFVYLYLAIILDQLYYYLCLGVDGVDILDYCGFLSPMNYVLKEVGLIGNYVYQEDLDAYICQSVSFQGGQALAGIALAGLVFYLLGFLLYRKRKLEYTGDLLVFPALKSLFCWGVGICVAFLGLAMAVIVCQSVNVLFTHRIGMLSFLLIGMGAFSLAAMLAEKRFFILGKKYLKQWGIFALALLAVYGGFYLTQIKLENYIPEADQVASVIVTDSYPITYEGEDVEEALEMQRQLLTHKEQLQVVNRELGDVEASSYITFTYTMKNGKVYSRGYNIPYDSQYLSILDGLCDREDDDATYWDYLYSEMMKEDDSFSYGEISYRLADDTMESSSSFRYLSQIEETLAAIKKDAAEGNLSKYNSLSYRKYYQAYVEGEEGLTTYELNLDFYDYDTYTKLPYSQALSGRVSLDSYYVFVDNYPYSSRELYLNIGPDCKNTLDALQSEGLITEDAGEFYQFSQFSYE